jgi:hypothetical protein
MSMPSILKIKESECSVVNDAVLDKTQAILSESNPLQLQKGDKLAIEIEGKAYFRSVHELVKTKNAIDGKTIRINAVISSTGAEGKYWKISGARYKLKLLFGPPKSKIAMLGFFATVSGAGATAYRAYHATGAGQYHDHLVTLSLLVVTAFGAFLSWAKEVI